jgi:hypothetical protein
MKTNLKDHTFAIPNTEKIVKSSGIPGLMSDYTFADNEAGFLMRVEWPEHPGHEEFAHDLYKI